MLIFFPIYKVPKRKAQIVSLLSDIPVRTLNAAAPRTLDADLFAFDFGPMLSFDFTDKLRMTASAGGPVAWINSKFSYRDGDFADGKESESDWLFGATASADLQFGDSYILRASLFIR